MEVCGANLRLHACSPGRTASFASLFFIILYHEGIILTVTNFTGSTRAYCLLALLEVSRRGRSPEDRLIYLVDHERICTPGLLQPVHTFPTLVQTCTICCTLGRISNARWTRGLHRFGVCRACWAPHPRRASLYLPLILRCLLGAETATKPMRYRIWRRKGQSERVWDDIVCTTARSFIPFLFPPSE